MGSFAAADALIVGSSVKEGGLWSNRLDGDHVRAVARAFQALAAGPEAAPGEGNS
jgi:predicted TIM-barrel enzyme